MKAPQGTTTRVTNGRKPPQATDATPATRSTRSTNVTPATKRYRDGWPVACWLLMLGLGAAPAFAAGAAQIRLSERLGLQSMAGRSGPDCTGGIIYDDGNFEDATAVPVTNGLLVMSFDLPSNAAGVQQVCVALTRMASTASPDLPFHAVFYAADGPSGTPGTLLASVPSTATAVPVTNSTVVNTQFYAVSIGSALTLPAARTIYAGVQYDGTLGFFLGIDTSVTTPFRPAFVSNNGGITWQTEENADPSHNYHAFGIRVDPVLAQTNCVPTTTAMCLQGSRFQVQATFQALGAPQGQAETVQLTDDSGYLWFFTAANIEAIVKVLDGCALNQHFWVFAGGLTNVKATITVTDTQTGRMKTYTNPQKKAFQPIQDTGALPCP